MIPRYGEVTDESVAAFLVGYLETASHHPVVLGRGKKVFPDGAAPATVRLLAPPIASEKGAVVLRYGPAGEVRTSDMGAPDRKA